MMHSEARYTSLGPKEEHVYNKTTEPMDEKLLAVTCEQPGLKQMAHARRRRMRMCLVLLVSVVLLAAGAIASYYLIVRQRHKLQKWVSYEGVDSAGHALQETAEVDTANQRIVHSVLGVRVFTSLHLYGKNLVLVKETTETDCYITEDTELFADNVKMLGEFQSGHTAHHPRVLYRRREAVDRQRLMQMGGDAAVAFCLEQRTWRMEIIGSAEVVPVARELPATSSMPKDKDTSSEEPGTLSKLFALFDIGSGEGSGSVEANEEGFHPYPATEDDGDERTRRESDECVGLLTLHAELYPAECA